MILRVLFFLLVMVPFLLIAIPVQFVITRFGLPYWNILPRVFHRLACVFLGLKVRVIGNPATGRPTLLCSNHISWTDVIVIGAVADVTFVAKTEIGGWPMVGFMASLQRTIFVDRARKADAHRTSREMGQRMADNSAVLLFAEGVSDIGTHVLPFRSALVGAAQHAMEEAGARDVAIQPLTIAYTRMQGLPISRTERSLIAWIRSKSVLENIREILTGGSKDVTIAFGIPRPLLAGDDRKDVTKAAENDVRRMLVALNRGHKLPAVE